MELISIIAAVVFPPLGVFLQVGLSAAFWLNIVFTVLGWLPGVIHALWIITRR